MYITLLSGDACLYVGDHDVSGLGLPLDVGNLLVGDGLNHLRQQQPIAKLALEVLNLVLALTNKYLNS